MIDVRVLTRVVGCSCLIRCLIRYFCWKNILIKSGLNLFNFSAVNVFDVFTIVLARFTFVLADEIKLWLVSNIKTFGRTNCDWSSPDGVYLIPLSDVFTAVVLEFTLAVELYCAMFVDADCFKMPDLAFSTLSTSLAFKSIFWILFLLSLLLRALLSSSLDAWLLWLTWLDLSSLPESFEAFYLLLFEPLAIYRILNK